MSNAIVKNAVIVLGVKRGETDFNLDLGPVLKARQKEVDLLKQTSQEVSALVRLKKEEEAANRAVQVSAQKSASAIAELVQVEREEAVANIAVQESAQKAASELAMLQQTADQAAISFSTSLIGSVLQASSGLLTMARGFVLLGVSGEENLRAVAEKLAVMQGAVDAFKGAISVYKTVISVQERWTKITQASAAATALATAAVNANTASRAANSASTAAQTTAVTANTVATLANVAAKKLLMVVTNPVGAAVAATIALLTAAVFWRTRETETIKDQIDALEQERQARERSIKVDEARERLGGASRSEARLTASKRQVKSIDVEIEALKKKAKAEREAHESVPRFKGRHQEILDGRQREFEILEKIAHLNDQRVFAALSVQEAEKSVADEAKRAADEKQRLAEQEKKAAEDQKKAAEQFAKYQSNQINKEKQLLNAQQDRIRGNQAAVGRLDALQRQRLENIAERKQGGQEIGREDLNFLGGLGGGFAKFANEQFVDKGQGAGDILNKLGITSDNQTAEEVADSLKLGEDLRTGISDVFTKITTTLTNFNDQMDSIQQRVQNGEDQAAKGAAL
tara:strand:+ start:25481 stop:27196 length:1716 start_codon:yes stop_codon:yes gene_type:complete